MARQFTGVLSSGVEIVLRSLVGDDQADLTSQKGGKDGSAFNKMLAGAILRLGNKTNVTENDVERMLSNDRKDSLVMLRQHSLRFQEFFKFAYDWPLAGKRKQLQQYEVAFNDEDFARKPYAWVQAELDRIEALKKRAAEDENFNEPIPALGTGYQAFPVLFDSYEEMLAQHAEQEYTMPESGEKVVWALLTGTTEKKFATVPTEHRSSNTPLQMRNPRVVSPVDANIRTSWQPGRADINDVEGFRGEIRRVEGFIDTILTIKNQVDESQVQRVDLVTTADFFFPSQAL